MPTYTERSVLPGFTAQDLWTWHQRPGAFERLVPPWQQLALARPMERLEDGAVAELALTTGPITWSWRAEHRNVVEGEGFVDEATSGPFHTWVHEHRFEDGPDGAVLTDRVTWELPLPPLGRLAAGWFARHNLRTTFPWRHLRTRLDLTEHARFADRPRLTVAISGATGLVGGALAAFLTTGGHRVRRLVRRDPGPDDILWRPADGTLDPAELAGVDAVVHLAGAPISGARWTPERKRLIKDSRVDGTRLLAEALASLPDDERPDVFVSASATGFYGHPPDEVDESSPAGEGFLAEVGAAWESAARPAAEAGVRVVHPRIGIVISGDGGALPAMLPAFRAGVGGPLGTGRQGLCWIALDDLLGLIHEMLWRDDMEGPYNAVAPQPLTQRTFARTLGGVLRRPAVLPAPAPAVRLLLGEMGQALLLEGPHVRPTRTLEAGFTHRFPRLEDALRFELGRLPLPSLP